MKKTILRLCLAIAIVGLAVSCGGGGDNNKDYQFGGRWAATIMVTVSNVPNIPVGFRAPDVLIIAQTGTNIAVAYQSTASQLLMNGTCNPDAGNFSAWGVDTSGIRNDIAGAGVDDDSMSGTFSMQKGSLLVQGTWTADLAARAAGGADAGSAARTLAAAFVR